MALVAATSGCGVTKELCRYTKEQLQYHEIVEDCLTTARVRKVARSAWCDFQSGSPESEFSHDYAAGFEDGFVDYVIEGPGAAPLIPPRRYWTVCNQNALGHQKAQDWFEGFRAGTTAAEQSGYRACTTVPTPSSPL
jgi:hypothetical protein